MLIFAHRGASHYAPENTLIAFKKAIAMGSTALECDVTLSKDNEIMVIHDDDITRVTGRAGMVKHFTQLKLGEMDAGSWFDPSFVNEGIPTLAQLLDIVPESVLLNIELKHMPGRFDLPEKVFDLLQKRRRKNILISSFNHLYILQYGKLDKKRTHSLALLYENDHFKNPLAMAFYKTRVDAINIHLKDTTQNNIAYIHDNGLKVNVYTVNSRKTALSLQKLKVDGIFSNLPDIMTQPSHQTL